MLDINIIREQPDVVRKALADRQDDPAPVGQILELDRQRRLIIQEVESLKAERNAASKEIGKTKDPAERQAKIEAMRQVGERISQLDETLRKIEEQLNAILTGIPNIPDARTPYGKDESENVVLRGVGEIPEFDFEPKAHWDLGPGSGHPGLRTGGQDHRLAFLRAQRGRCPPAARPDRLDARPAHPPGVYREVHPLHGQGTDHVQRRAAAQIQG